ncbi:MAG: TIM barrel protein [Hyphomicrobiales bacterium]|nr:TIM barrel protein [Hyphomicrobiales bacterium]
MPRFSANLGLLWPDRSLLSRVDAAASAGFKAVEFQFPYEAPALKVRASCVANNVSLLGINTAIDTEPGGHRGLAAVPGREAEFEKLADQAVAYCTTAGGNAIHVMAGLVEPAHHDAAADVLVGNLSRTAEKAANAGLTILIEPLNRRDMPGYFYSRIEQAADIIDRVAAPNLKLMFDVYHVGVGQGDILTRLRTHLPHIGHVQIASVPDRSEPDGGEIAYRAVFDELDQLGYDGWIGCEYTPQDGTDAGLTWTSRLGVTL